MADTRCGFIAIVGEPNAGKSTLINRLVGGKVSIVTPKAQTTRFNVRGVCAQEEAQMIFVDTPGIFAAGKRFEKAMVQAAWGGIGDADAVLMLIDARQGLRNTALQVMEKLKGAKKPVFLAINKIDAVKKAMLLELAQACNAQGVFERIFMISALKGDGVEDIKTALAGHMPHGPWLYPAEQMSDISLRLLAAEVTREKVFLLLEKELPYAAFVETEAWEEGKTSVNISQAITVQREGQKKIILGAKGDMIKRIGTSARRELETILGKRVHLELFVKVRAGWKDDIESYRLLGLEFRK
ncbi:MAG: GTPase Era [Pseudomonadota bacterium]|nr:GTPase Era [Pseudomonadota bacterium]